MEMEAKTGQPLAAASLKEQRAECRQRYQAAVKEYTENEKAAIRRVVALIDPLIRPRYPQFARTPWNFLKVANNLEAGFPHTRGKHIVLAVNICRSLASQAAHPIPGHVPLGGITLLLHELMHVFQRAHEDQFVSLYQGQWGFVRARSIVTCPWIVEHQLLNPDAVDCLWVFPLSSPEGTKYIWPLCAFGDGPGPKRMTSDFSMLAVSVTRQGDDFRVQGSADGRPKYSELLSVRAFRDTFPESSNIYHPHEASADLFARLVVFDGYLSLRMSADERVRKEKNFGKYRDWFRKNLAETDRRECGH
jgi:hypothetical protein